MKGQSYMILAFIFALVIAIFAVINVEPVRVNYLFGTGEAPLILVILMSVLLGGFATASVGAVRYFKMKRANRLLRQQLDGVGLESDSGNDQMEVSSDEDGSNDENKDPKSSTHNS